MTAMTRRKFLITGSLASTGILIGCSIRNRFDLIIQNGLILDGLKQPAFHADLGIREQFITAIGDLSNCTANRIIDATGLVISPGFIDIHTHTDTELLVDTRAASKLQQGVTTEVSGNCGSSPFPLTPVNAAEHQQQLLEKYGIDAHWQNLAEFFQLLEANPPAINYVTLTGHGNLRTVAVGKQDVPPTEDQLHRMQELLVESMEMGSFGLSTGLEYAPGSYAQTDELVALCRTTASRDGLYATHVRNEDDRVEAAVAEALQVARKSGVSLQISHLKACNLDNWSKVPALLEQIDAAIRSSLPVMADRYPYNAWSTGLGSFIPLWARQGETDDILARLKDEAEWAKITNYAESRGQRIGGWERVMISSVNSDTNKALQGKTIQEAAALQQLPPLILIRELLIAERIQVGVIGFAMNEDNLKRVLAAPFVMIGSDGSAVAPDGKLSEGNPHPRSYGTFPRVLGKYCREEKIFDLSTAVYKMTGMAAQKLGLQQRGVIREKYYADLTIFNPETVLDTATYTKPHQFAQGIEYVIVNGKIALSKGEQTKIRAGQILRKV
jgi:N-acyl-D-amino-acid deacylase